jgi:hypothetical protein
MRFCNDFNLRRFLVHFVLKITQTLSFHGRFLRFGRVLLVDVPLFSCWRFPAIDAFGYTKRTHSGTENTRQPLQTTTPTRSNRKATCPAECFFAETPTIKK